MIDFESKNTKCTASIVIVLLVWVGIKEVNGHSANHNLGSDPAGSKTLESKSGRFDAMKRYLASIPAIDTHEHLWPMTKFSTYVQTGKGPGMNFYGLWNSGYSDWAKSSVEWINGMSFEEWWAKAQSRMLNYWSTSAFQVMLPAFKELYGVDLNSMTDEQARQLDKQIFEHYRNESWVRDVVTEKANIELMFIDSFWRYGEIKYYYPFQVLVLRVQTFLRGFHPSEFDAKFQRPNDSPINPYSYARQYGMTVNTLEDYLELMERVIADARSQGTAAMKQAVAYYRTLSFEQVPITRAKKAFGRPRSELSAEEIKAFEDFIMWKLAELSAKYDMPLQIHTGTGQLPGSNPMNLVNLIQGNPNTKFILFHGGIPWVSECAVIAYRNPRNVWLDANWMPILSYTMAKRAFHEWLDLISSNRIMWGGDSVTAEAIYGATDRMRSCVAEVLTERTESGNLTLQQAQRIGRQIFRENALALFPQLKDRLWKGKGTLPAAPVIRGLQTSHQ